jgi:uncharacterized metal-binding protein YceD (DUF177 family)
VKLYLPLNLDRLRDGHPETIEAVLPPEVIVLPKGDELVFDTPISVQGEAYLTDRFLILDLSIKTEVQLPCSFCNDSFKIPLDIVHYMHEEPLDELKGRFYEVATVVQEALLLEIPLYPLCGNTVCLRRGEVEPYLK